MMVKSRALLFCVLWLAVATLALGGKDTELKRCKHRCKALQHISKQEKRDCYQVCEKYQQGEEEKNPYVFEEKDFITGVKTQHGSVRVLQNFTQRSNLLKAIQNYIVDVVDAQPHTFVVPNHWDAESVIFIAHGRGTLSLLHRGKRNSFNVRQGDVIRILAGTTAYMINRDTLFLVELLRPIFTPGHFEAFFGAGGGKPVSFYNTFSSEILEAALNTRRDRLQRLFGQQREGIVIKASEEQVRTMSQHEEGGISPSSFNIFKQRPSQSNQYGQLYEVDGSIFRQLDDVDTSVSFANITKGGMLGPLYSSRATKIGMVVDGEGFFEMACPHISGRQMKIGTGYQKVRTRLSHGMVVIIPPGHPFVKVASNNHNLQVVWFNINARNNEIVPLAGRNNVMSQLEREAMELAFGVPAREVEEIFRSQQEELFFQGPGGRQKQQEGGRADA